MLGVKIQDNGGDTAVVTDGKLEVSVTGVNFPDATLYIPGYATEATLGDVETAIDDVVTGVGLLATQVTAAAILAKLPTSGATEAKQDTEIGHLANILDAVDSIDTRVATSAKQDTLKTSVDAITTKLSADPATQTTSAAILAKIPAASTVPGQYNITMTLADTEYSQGLPTGCKGFEFWTRSGETARWAFTTGKVATPTTPYFTLLRGATYQSYGELNLTGVTLYVATAVAGDVVELITWS